MKMRATQNFAYGTDVAEAWMAGGTVLDDHHPLVKAFPDFFEPVYETVSNPVPEVEPEPPAPKKVAPRRRRDV